LSLLGEWLGGVMSLNIEITGVEAVIAKLGHIKGSQMLVPPMNQSVAMMKGDVTTYPSPPAGSTYRRTGTLGRRWATTVSVHSNGVEGKVGNNTVYAPWVQSSRFQAGIHRGRWVTDAQVMERRRSAIIALFNSAISRALGR
jgi:hypothetical protein